MNQNTVNFSYIHLILSNILTFWVLLHPTNPIHRNTLLLTLFLFWENELILVKCLKQWPAYISTVRIAVKYIGWVLSQNFPDYWKMVKSILTDAQVLAGESIESLTYVETYNMTKITVFMRKIILYIFILWPNFLTVVHWEYVNISKYMFISSF